ncbi:hypothetical protein WDU94_006600 [Cyamophila willieti]
MDGIEEGGGKPPDPPFHGSGSTQPQHSPGSRKANLYDEDIYYPDFKIVIQSIPIDNKPRFLCSQKVGQMLSNVCNCTKEQILDINRLTRSKVVVTLSSARIANAVVQNVKAKELFNIFIPAAYTCRYAVVKGINMEFSDADLLDSIDARQHKILSVQRMNRRKVNEDKKVEYVKSTTVRILFQGADIPKHIYLFFNRIPCEPCVMAVRQCFKCFRFGHTTKFCRSSAKCRSCSSDFNNDHKCTVDPKCVNCSNSHIATNPNCSELERQKNIKKLMSIRRVLYQEAAQTFTVESESSNYSVATQNRFSALSDEFPSLQADQTNDNIEPYVPSPSFLKIPTRKPKAAAQKPSAVTNECSIKKKHDIPPKEPLAKRLKNIQNKRSHQPNAFAQNKPLLGFSFSKPSSTPSATSPFNPSQSSRSPFQNKANLSSSTFTSTSDHEQPKSSAWFFSGNQLFPDEKTEQTFHSNLSRKLNFNSSDPLLTGDEDM